MKLVTSIAALSPWLLPSLYIPPVKRDWPPPPPTHFSQNARVSVNMWDWPCLTGNSGAEGNGEDYLLFIWSTHGRRFLLSSSWALELVSVQRTKSALSPWEFLDRFIASSYTRSILIRRVKGPPPSIRTGQRSFSGELRFSGWNDSITWVLRCVLICIFWPYSNPKWVDWWTFLQLSQSKPPGLKP